MRTSRYFLSTNTHEKGEERLTTDKDMMTRILEGRYPLAGRPALGTGDRVGQDARTEVAVERRDWGRKVPALLSERAANGVIEHLSHISRGPVSVSEEVSEGQVETCEEARG